MTDTSATLSFGTGLRALAPFARDDRARYALSAGLAVAGTICQLGPFWVIYRAISDVVDGSATRDGLFGLGALALVFVVAEHAFMAASTDVSHRAAFGTLQRLRLQIGDRLSRVPLGFVTRRRSGEIQRTLTDDVERLELFLAHAIPDLVAAASVVALTTTWLFVVDWRMALAALVSVAVALVLMVATQRRGGAKMGDYLAALARMNGSVVEFVRGLPVVRTFNRTGETFAETRDAVRAAAVFQAEWGREFLPIMTAFYTVAAGAALTIVPAGVWLWLAGSVSTVDLLFFFVLGLAYTAPVLRLTELLSQLSLLTLGARLVAELHGAPELPEPAQPAAVHGASVEFVDVDFAYPGETDAADRQALSGVSFTAAPGTVTALVGPSGAGKSTVARLICRFYDVDAGRVRVGGVDVRDQPFTQLMAQVAFVFQETFLFDDTVAANIRLGRAMTEVQSAPPATDQPAGPRPVEPFYAGPIRSTWRLFGPRRAVLTTAVAFRFVQALFQAAPAVALVWVIDLVRRDALTTGTAWAAVGLVLGGAAGQYLAGYAANRLAWISTFHAVGDARERGLAHLHRLPMGTLLSRGTGDIAAVLTADFQAVSNFAHHGLMQIFGAIGLPAFVLLGLLVVDPPMAAAVAVSIAVAVPLFR